MKPSERVRHRKSFIVWACILQLLLLLVLGFQGTDYMNDSAHNSKPLLERYMMHTLNVENMLYAVFLLVGSSAYYRRLRSRARIPQGVFMVGVDILADGCQSQLPVLSAH